MRFTPNQIRALLVALAFVLSVLVGVVAGVLARQDDNTVPGSILYGGGAFIAFMTLVLVVMGALGWLSNAGSEPAAQSGQFDTPTITPVGGQGRPGWSQARSQRTGQ